MSFLLSFKGLQNASRWIGRGICIGHVGKFLVLANGKFDCLMIVEPTKIRNQSICSLHLWMRLVFVTCIVTVTLL